MNGPFADGTHAAIIGPFYREALAKHFVRGTRYRVTATFKDADGDQHVTGEEWTFITCMFDRYFDTYIICVQRDGGGEWRIPLGPEQEYERGSLDRFMRPAEEFKHLRR